MCKNHFLGKMSDFFKIVTNEIIFRNGLVDSQLFKKRKRYHAIRLARFS